MKIAQARAFIYSMDISEIFRYYLRAIVNGPRPESWTRFALYYRLDDGMNTYIVLSYLDDSVLSKQIEGSFEREALIKGLQPVCKVIIGI